MPWIRVSVLDEVKGFAVVKEVCVCEERLGSFGRNALRFCSLQNNFDLEGLQFVIL